MMRGAHWRSEERTQESDIHNLDEPDTDIDSLVPTIKRYRPLRKHAYSNILKILQPKKGKFSVKKR